MKNKILSLSLIAALTASLFIPADNAFAAKKIKLSKTNLTLTVGSSKKIALKKGKKTIKGKWSSNLKKIATVKNGKITGKSVGSAIITVKKGKKKYTCHVVVKAKKTKNYNVGPTTTSIPVNPGYTQAPYNPGYTQSPYNPGYTKSPTAPTYTSIPVSTQGPIAGLEDNGFDYATDVTIKDYAKMGRVEFTINEETTSAAELEAAGYTITTGANGKKSASKDTILEYRDYTFKKIPNTLRGLKTIPLDGAYTVDSSIQGNAAAENGIGFNVMAATCCAAANFKGYANPSDPMGDKDPTIQEIRKMFEYLNGPREANNISNVRWQTCVNSMKDATAKNNSGNPNVYLSYFGAKSTNNYADPGEGNYKLTVYRGPYMIPAKETITGKRPETYMIFVGSQAESNDWGTDRYLDVWHSSDGNWYSWDDNYLHVTANNFKKAEEGF